MVLGNKLLTIVKSACTCFATTLCYFTYTDQYVSILRPNFLSRNCTSFLVNLFCPVILTHNVLFVCFGFKI